VKKKPSRAEIMRKAATGLLLPRGGVVNQIIADLQGRRAYAAEHALGAITERVGRDAFDSIVKRDPEIEALLWMVLQAIVATGVESKRKLLQDVVANAMTSREPIDMAQLQTMVLAELDAPHFRALTRLAHAEDMDSAEGKTDRPNNSLDQTVAKEPVPLLAALIRTGVVYPAETVHHGDGTASAPSPRELRLSGVTDFGRRLLADLQQFEG
jgi:hypothetical protein